MELQYTAQSLEFQQWNCTIQQWNLEFQSGSPNVMSCNIGLGFLSRSEGMSVTSVSTDLDRSQIGRISEIGRDRSRPVEIGRDRLRSVEIGLIG